MFIFGHVAVMTHEANTARTTIKLFFFYTPSILTSSAPGIKNSGANNGGYNQSINQSITKLRNVLVFVFNNK